MNYNIIIAEQVLLKLHTCIIGNIMLMIIIMTP